MTSIQPVGLKLGAPTARRVVVAGVVLLTAFRLAYAAGIGLMPQEAYYWCYATHPALSYLDHPPMVAWWIAAGTALLGHDALGVRLLGVLSSAALTGVVYRLGERLFSPLAGVLAAVVANATILFSIGAVILTPDVPLTLFWAAALLVACDLLLEDGRGPGRFAWRWYLLGLLAGCAYLSKYTAALLPLCLLVAALVLPRGRRALRTPHPWLAVGLSLLVFTPVLVWNADHHLASFAFQTTRRARHAGGPHLALVGQYLGTQAAVVTPVIFGAVLYALVAGGRRALAGDGRHRLLLLVTAPGGVLFTALSPFLWVKMNWLGPIYLGALVALAGLWAAGWARRRVRVTAGVAVGLGVAATVVAHLLPLVPAIPVGRRGDTWDGWGTLAAAVDRDLPDDPRAFVIGWDYMTAAELAWHLPGGDRRVTGANAIGGRGRAFADWLDPASVRRATAVVVVDARHPLPHAARHLTRYCRRVETLAPVVTHRDGRPLTTFRLFRCIGYRPGHGRAVSRSSERRAPRPWPSPAPPGGPSSPRPAGA